MGFRVIYLVNERGIGKLFMNSTFAQNADGPCQYYIRQGGFKQNMDAAGYHFILRGFVK